MPKLFSFSFPTSCPPPVSDSLPRVSAFVHRTMVPLAAKLPEELFIRSAATAASLLEGSRSQAQLLSSLFKASYRAIKADADFDRLRSAVPYCFSRSAPKQAHYFASIPQKHRARPEAIVFLHGYGGNFLFYLWALKLEFLEAVLLVPSWNLDWTLGSEQRRMTYLRDMISHFSQETGIEVATPYLFGISQGGLAGFELAAFEPQAFRAYVSIASYPGATTGFSRDFPMLMINGSKDDRFPLEDAVWGWNRLHDAGSSISFAEVDSGHFFFLSHREETGALVRKFLETNVRQTAARAF